MIGRERPAAALLRATHVPLLDAERENLADVIEELAAERDALRAAMQLIAARKTSEELFSDAFRDADFQGAYDKFIRIARAAIRARGEAGDA